MSNDTYSMNSDKSISYGAKLKAAREAMGLEQKDIAAQLRLGERIIDMLESGHYASDIPVTFIRGYIRSYSKLLQIADNEIAAALEPIQPIQAPQDEVHPAKQPAGIFNARRYMQFSTYGIVATLAGMLGLWWYSHTPAQMVTIAQEQPVVIPEVQKPDVNKPVASVDASTPSITNPSVTSASNDNAEHTTTVASAKPTTAKSIIPKTAHDDMDDDEPDNNNYTD